MAKPFPLHQQKIDRAICEVADTIREQDHNQAIQNLASDLRQLAHMVFGGLVVAQAFSDQLNTSIAIVGVAMLVTLYMIAHIISRGGDL